MYPFQKIEKKWQTYWQQNPLFQTITPQRPKCYVLEMFPYPSGRLHMGHVRNYAIGDAIARFKHLKGYDVLHPMGWDAFGLPAENAARSRGVGPQEWTMEHIKVMKAQLNVLGFSYDWNREIITCLPDYYGHSQRIFLDFYRHGLVEQKESWVNWDPVEETVLANEQVINGRGWRSGALVEQKRLRQWFIKITRYAQELLDDLDHLTGWPEKVRRMQENWIGRSEGMVIYFTGEGEKIPVYSTRPETLFGASFVAIAPTHPLATRLAIKNPTLQEFIRDCQRHPTTEESLSTLDKKGFDTGLRVVHPLLPQRSLPVYVANFVLMDYGTGAIFGCPAHDERDQEFAQRYNLPLQPVLSDDDTLIHSDFLNGLTVSQARQHIKNVLEERGLGQAQVQFRLRDWGISRQRYWGCPIPIIHCQGCGTVPVPLEDLPVTLPPQVSFEAGGNPLDHHETWKHVSCPQCGAPSTRETDTFDTFFESSWYFLRFCNPHSQTPVDAAACQQWMPVDHYIGGVEHAVLHLLYARFFTKALRDCGYGAFHEPFKNLLTQGMVCHQTFQDTTGEWLYPHQVVRHKNGPYTHMESGQPVKPGRAEKMSKSKNNVVDPQHIIATYGADAARLFVLSDTPPERDFDWSEEGIDGAWRYLNRLWRLGETLPPPSQKGEAQKSLHLRRLTHQTLLKVDDAYERQAFNKVIAFVRELSNHLETVVSLVDANSAQEAFQIILLSLSPIVPHITQELWEVLGYPLTLSHTPWPQPDPALLVTEAVTIAVQVNGKLRGSFQVPPHTPQEAIETQALEVARKALNGQAVRRLVVVPNRLVNIVV